MTVGGATSTVIRANGHEVVVRVPDDAPFGTVPIVLTNPGGQTASGELQVRWDGNLSFVDDADRAASATIGRAGGSISAGGIVLDVPADALAGDVEITVTPILAVDDPPFDDAFVAGRVSGTGGTALPEAGHGPRAITGVPRAVGARSE